MTDREMLEFAAKSAGKDMEYMQWDGFRFVEQNIHGAPHCGLNYEETWNPLTDDGDALRMAVKLGFMVYIDVEDHYTEVEFTSNYEEKSTSEGHAFDAMAATRRAIVRAAAEIGKVM